LIEKSFQRLSIAIETVRIVEELMEIWLNEVCDRLSAPFLQQCKLPVKEGAEQPDVQFAN